MREDLTNLIAFALLIVAILYLATVAAYLAFHGKYAEALGFGGLTTGLVGVLGTFKPRTPGNTVSSADIDNKTV